MKEEIFLTIWGTTLTIEIEDYIVDKEHFQDELSLFMKSYLKKQTVRLEESITNLLK